MKLPGQIADPRFLDKLKEAAANGESLTTIHESVWETKYEKEPMKYKGPGDTTPPIPLAKPPKNPKRWIRRAAWSLFVAACYAAGRYLLGVGE